MNRTASAYLAAIAAQWPRGKRANSKQSKYLAAERPQERLLLTVEDSLRYYWQAYSPAGGRRKAAFGWLRGRLQFYFGKARQAESSHQIYRTPWQGDPRVNIQNDNGKAKAYQVRQVLQAIERLERENGDQK